MRPHVRLALTRRVSIATPAPARFVMIMCRHELSGAGWRQYRARISAPCSALSAPLDASRHEVPSVVRSNFCSPISGLMRISLEQRSSPLAVLERPDMLSGTMISSAGSSGAAEQATVPRLLVCTFAPIHSDYWTSMRPIRPANDPPTRTLTLRTITRSSARFSLSAAKRGHTRVL